MTLALLDPRPERLPLCFKSLVPPDGRITRARARYLLEVLAGLTPELRRHALRTLPPPALRAIYQEWWWQVHEGQAEPEGEWRIWAIVAGRGFGKTRAGAEWVWARARENGKARIALVGATVDEVVRVMVRGESGLLAVARDHERPRWIPSLGLVRFPSGAEAHAFSAERPERLRGPQHHFAWCDELGKWPWARANGRSNADDAWNNLMLGLRLGEHGRAMVTTTPSRSPLLRRILALPGCEKTEGRTEDNPALAGDFVSAMRDMFAGTRLARQELDGILLEDFEGALWTRDLLKRSRQSGTLPREERGWAGSVLPVRKADGEGDRAKHGGGAGPGRSTAFTRIVVGVDPPASTGGDSCGIVVCGQDADGIAWVLADLTAAGLSPEAWARRVADAADLYGASRVVAEKNQGGDMIASILRAVDANLPIRLVAATRSKAARAEPIALRFETGRARLAGHFPDLEDQLCALTWSGYQLPGSPDRADAMVWAMTELFEKQRGEPRIRRL
ncbi:MAG: DNA-packaging protein [Allosphingosinicella sp.]